MKQTKSNRILKESSIADLHESMLINVLIFLPIQCILRCRCVCKTWATLISQPYFIELYDSTKKPALIQLLIEDRSLLMKPNNLFLAQLDEAACTAHSPADFLIFNKTRFSLKFLDDFPDHSQYMFKIFSTCSVTGFIAAYRFDGKEDTSVVSCHIFNPVTGQHILVDDNAISYRWERLCALLYAQKTNQFKFLDFHPSLTLEEVEVDIQTIGTNSWRSMGKIPFFPRQLSLPTFANGLYYWIDPRKHIIYSFNAEEEVFEQIQTPSRIKSFHSSNLGLLDGCLCICLKHFNYIELWVMSGDGDEKSWTKKFVLRNTGIGPGRTVEPLKCLENGDVVILCYPLQAICYNPTTKSRKYIRFDSGKPSIRYRPFSYIPSLRSVLPAST